MWRGCYAVCVHLYLYQLCSNVQDLGLCLATFMAKVAPVDGEIPPPKAKFVKLTNTEDALSSRYQTAGLKLDGNEDKDRYMLKEISRSMK